jgi:uncharacterized membrane protein YuzA (DUF378 family)
MILVPGGGGGKGVRIDVGVSLLVIVALEASLLGSGRMVEIGPLTLKMWLFLAAGLYVVFRLVAHGCIKLSTFAILLSFAVLLCFGASMGVLQHTSLDPITEDVKPLVFCFILCFVEMTMKTARHLHTVVRIIKSSSIIMTIAMVVIVILISMGVINFARIYESSVNASEGGDLLFRGSNGFFFYKGSLYIAIGLIFFAFDRNWRAKVASFIAILGILATGSRGYFLGLVAVILVHCVTGKGGMVRRLRYFIVPSAAAIMLLFILYSGSLVGKKDSDATRFLTVNQVMDRVNPLSFVFGHGLGVGVPERPTHMEISYLEIFQKQGLLGLTWWASVFMLLLIRYRKARNINYTYAQPLFLSVIFVIVESATNPFINNPIGIFVWIIALVGLDVLSGAQTSSALLGQRELAVS